MATSEPHDMSEQNKHPEAPNKPLLFDYSFDHHLIPLDALKYAEVTGTICYTVVRDGELNRMRGMKE
jgi:hypothetical protein